MPDDRDDGGLRNWLPPKRPQDHGKHAGANERKAMEVLGFEMRLGGKGIAVGNGIVSKNGFLDEAVLRQWGVSIYADLWGKDGKVVGAARARMGEAGWEREVSEAGRALDESLWHRLADKRKYEAELSHTLLVLL